MRNVIPTSARLIPPQAKCVFHGVIFDVYQWPQKMFDGSDATFEMLRRPDTIQVIAVRGGKIVILDEEQPGSPPFLGLPGGRHDHAAESELDAAKRELAEETGLTFKTWKLLSVKQAHPKIEHFIYHFLATDFDRAGERNLDPGEKITVLYRTFDEVKALADDPKARYFAPEIIGPLGSLQELLDLPEFTAM